MNQKQLLETALKLAESRYYIYPLSLYKNIKGKKAPDVRLQWAESSTVDPKQIRDWYSEPRLGMQGIGIDCEKSGIVVIDLDISETKDGVAEWAALPWTASTHFSVTTPSGGSHLFFRSSTPLKTSAGQIAPSVDLRSMGGTVFTGPTEYDGKAYTFDSEIVPVCDLPALPDATRIGIEAIYRARGIPTHIKPLGIDRDIVLSESRARDLVSRALLRFQRAPHFDTIFGYASQRFKLEKGLSELHHTDYDPDTVEESVQNTIRSSGPWEDLDHNDITHIANARRKALEDPWLLLPDSKAEAGIPSDIPLTELRSMQAPRMPGSPKYDQAAASQAVIDALAGRFINVYGIGWLEWNGREWTHGQHMTGSPLHETAEAGRLAKARARRMLRAVETNEQMQGINAALSKLVEEGKTESDLAKTLRKEIDSMEPWVNAWESYSKWWSDLGFRRWAQDVLAYVEANPGEIKVSPDVLDSNPHLLNCLNGVVDLRTGVLRPHDPKDYLTKSTRVEYHPDAIHPNWERARESFAPDTSHWLQLKAGAGAYGLPPSDDQILFSFGKGSNGKSTLADGIRNALGDYCVVLHDKAILGSPNDHGAEKMIFRGARWAILEELPEEQILRPVLIKKLVGTAEITAREMRQNVVTFKATHTILVNSNHKPTVLEADYGTWRRLIAIPWPYKYVPKHEVTESHHRPVDPAIRASLRSDREVKEAVLKWIVDGAREYAEAGFSCGQAPDAVEAASSDWRTESDIFGSFFRENLAVDPTHAVSCKELLMEYNKHLFERGKKPVSDTHVKSKMGSIDDAETVAHKVIKASQGTLTVSKKSETGSTQRYWAWVGIRWKTVSELQE